MPDTEDLVKENERLKSELERAKSVRAAKSRRVLVPILIVLTCISMVATTIGIWANRTIWDQDKYMERIVPIVEQPAVAAAIADQITDQALVALDVDARVQDALAQLSAQTDLPEQITFLAGPLTQSIKGLVHDKALEFVKSDTFQTYWEQANAALHPKVVALLNGDYDQLPNVNVGEEVVQLDLVPIVAKTLRDLAEQGLEGLDLNLTIPEIGSGDPRAAIEKLAAAVGHPLPEDFGQVTIMTSAQLESYQTAAGSMRAMAWVLAFLTIILVALSLVLSTNRRRTVAWLGISIAASMVLATVILRNVVRSIVESVESDQAREAAQQIVAQLGSSLRAAGALVGWTAFAIAVIAYLVGRPAWLQRLIDWAKSSAEGSGDNELQTWIGERADAARIVAIGVAVLVLFLVGVNLVSAILVGAVVAGALWWIGQSQAGATADGS